MKTKKQKVVELTKIEKAILALADYLEFENHADYRVKRDIMEILEIGYNNLSTPLTSMK